MAKKGFNMQPIVDDNKRCIGAIRLQDVLRYISDNGVDSLPETFELKTLEGCKLPSSSPYAGLESTGFTSRTHSKIWY